MEVDYADDGGIGYRSPAVVCIGALFPFGFGLGYSRTLAAVTAEGRDGEVELSIDIRNLGARDTVHVAQVYASAHGAQPWELVSWVRIPVPAGDAAAARISVTPDLLRRWDDGARERLPLPGSHLLKVSADAEDFGHQFAWTIPAG